MKTAHLDIEGIPVEVTFKRIRNIHLSVHPPNGRVRVSAPHWMTLESIEGFAASRLGWIPKHRAGFQAAPPAVELAYVNGEVHFVWGQRYLLHVQMAGRSQDVELAGERLILRVRSGATADGRAAVLNGWYRDTVRAAAVPLLQEWGQKLGVRPERLVVRRMRTRWGGCTPHTRTIRLNAELAKRPPECLQYVVVHELMHLIEPSHGHRFKALMDQHLPGWRQVMVALKHTALSV